MTPQPGTPATGSPVAYPTITVGGKTYQLRFAHGAWFQLQMWGYEIGDPRQTIPMLALAAAAAGEADPVTGAWKTAGFARPLDLADLMQPGETLSSLYAPVLEALEKAAPKATLTVVSLPAEQATPETPGGAPN